MHIKSVGAAFALTLLSTGAFAADLPARRAPPAYAPPPILAYDWSGFYVGAQGGYGSGRDNSVLFATAGGGGLAANGATGNGFIGGGHIGYNLSSTSLGGIASYVPFGGVLGVEGDVDGRSGVSNYALGGITVAHNDKVQGSVRGRLGFTGDRFGFGGDRVLVYATGGAAFAGMRNVYNNTITGVTDNLSQTRIGYTVGGGVEYAYTNNIILRGEFRYTDFGNSTNYLLATTGGGAADRHRDTDIRGQFGISYKFGNLAPPSPVVARY